MSTELFAEMTIEDLAQLMSEQVHELSQLTQLVLELKSQNERLLKGLTLCYKLLEDRPAAAAIVGTAAEIVTEPVTGPLEVNLLSGKFYYAVKVPSWQQYGVRVWPELLQQVGIEESSIDIRQPPDLTGWMCQYVLGDNGNPKKAIALTLPH